MQFAIVGLDGTDENALERRIAARGAHIALGDELVASGNGLFGGAVLDDAGNMIGSIKIVEFETQEEFDAYLALEPYVIGDVWRDMQVMSFKVGPSYGKSRNSGMPHCSCGHLYDDHFHDGNETCRWTTCICETYRQGE